MVGGHGFVWPKFLLSATFLFEEEDLFSDYMICTLAGS